MRYKYMKSLLIGIGILCLFTLASCRTIVQTPQIAERTPDVIKSPVQSATVNPTVVDVPKDTVVVVREGKPVSVVIQHETKAEVPQGILKGLLNQDETKEVIIPKNTEVVLPSNTPLKTVTPIKVTMEEGTEVIIPAGTEIATTKVNWYAILFYLIIIFGLGWYYVQIRKQPEDQNRDGFVDEDKMVVGKKRMKSTKKQ